MSSWSDIQDCPYCETENSFVVYGSNRPYDSGSGECLECGFCYYTDEKQMTLEEVNEQRLEHGKEPVTSLKPQK